MQPDDMLFAALDRNRIDKVKEALALGANPNLKRAYPGLPDMPKFRVSALWMALQCGEEAVNCLVAAGADLEKESKELLSRASKFLDCGAMKKHLEKLLAASREREALNRSVPAAAFKARKTI